MEDSMMKRLITLFSFSITVAFFTVHQARAHETINFTGTIEINIKVPEEKTLLYWTCNMHPSVEMDNPGKCPVCAMDLVPVYEKGTEAEEMIIKEDVRGEAVISQWGHEETNGNFDEAIFNFGFGAETSECGEPLEEFTVKVSSYRENKYTIKSEEFPFDLCEDGMSAVVQRILNKYGKTVQDALGLDECFSVTDGSGTTASGKIVSFAMRHISKGKVTITEHSDKIRFKVDPILKTFDAGFQNKKEYPMKILGNLELPRQDSQIH